MDVGCNCMGAAAASRRPVKRYNLLVPDIFPKTEPPFDQPVDATTERKFKKLVNYLEKTHERGPKVSAIPIQALLPAEELKSEGPHTWDTQTSARHVLPWLAKPSTVVWDTSKSVSASLTMPAYAHRMQVSRRLARKLSESLRKRRYGYVKLVAYAYIYLLAKLPPEDSGLLARELVCQEAVRPARFTPAWPTPLLVS